MFWSLTHQTVTVVNTTAGILIKKINVYFVTNAVNANSPAAPQGSHSTPQIPLMLQLTSFLGNAVLHCSSDNVHHSLPLNECYVKQRDQSEVQIDRKGVVRGPCLQNYVVE